MYKKEETRKKDEEIKKIMSYKDMDDSLKKSHKEGLIVIENDFKKNKDKAVEFLLESLLEVDLTVPDVVIGRFAHKLLNTTTIKKK